MAAHIYKLADGTRVPSVTTIINVLGFSKDALLYWAWKTGCDGKTLDDARNKAADVGTIAHAMIEAHLKGEELSLLGLPPELVERSRVAFAAWKEWAELTNYTVIASEQSLVSEEHRYGGTFDCVLVKGRRVMVDWKTASGIYPDHLVQVAAYGALWNEHHPAEKIEGFALLRLGRDEGLFDYHFRPCDGVMVDAWKTFRHARAIHELAGRLKKGGT